MKIISIIISIILIAGCKINNYHHEPGGPYFFKYHVTYQGFRPNGEISKEQAKELENQGYAYYIAYFNHITPVD